jgi:hypothetical protein
LLVDRRIQVQIWIQIRIRTNKDGSGSRRPKHTDPRSITMLKGTTFCIMFLYTSVDLFIPDPNFFHTRSPYTTAIKETCLLRNVWNLLWINLGELNERVDGSFLKLSLLLQQHREIN